MGIDRRVARTRTALYEALLSLIRRKHYELITVEEILAEANIGRSTFYAHFTSKDDLLKRSLERLRDLLVTAKDRTISAALQQEPEKAWDPSRALFEHVAEHADIRVALAGGRGGGIVRDAIDDVLAEILRKSLPTTMHATVPRDLVIRHMVSTFNAVLRWWLEERPEMTPREADAAFRKLVLHGVPPETCRPFIMTA
ncbi:TetR/AcrR family transcriptional regulator [Ensifer adhaerens]|uniref:TetR/AcrR family transcriptional regulator n=1 Tax=Ensifer adhaerens TaxID=106592 RepID=UPI00098EC8F2|nr:TetR/AcrR family transcriptional regulator [Ensifer adhaerens]